MDRFQHALIRPGNDCRLEITSGNTTEDAKPSVAYLLTYYVLAAVARVCVGVIALATLSLYALPVLALGAVLLSIVKKLW